MHGILTYFDILFNWRGRGHLHQWRHFLLQLLPAFFGFLAVGEVILHQLKATHNKHHLKTVPFSTATTTAAATVAAATPSTATTAAAATTTKSTTAATTAAAATTKETTCYSYPSYYYCRSSGCSQTRLVGLVVKVFASRAEDPGFESRLCRDFSGVESNQWLQNWHSSGYPARRLAL